jgi:hypothetical protein
LNYPGSAELKIMPSMPTNQIQLTFWFMGALVAIIYLLDAWRSSPNPEARLSQTPRLSGLNYVLRGFIIPVSADGFLLLGNLLSKEAQHEIKLTSILAYTQSLIGTSIVGLMLMAFYSFIISYNHISKVNPKLDLLSKLINTFPYVTLIIREGEERLLKELGALKLLQTQTSILLNQRDKSTSYLMGLFIALVENNLKHKSGVIPFLEFLDNSLTIFIQNFLEGQTFIMNFRASLYFCPDKTADYELVYLTGVAPPTIQHSKKSLSMQNSLAGLALGEPNKLHYYSSNSKSKDSAGRYESRPNSSLYKTVMCCAVVPLEVEGIQRKPRMVLCIDSLKDEDYKNTLSDEDYKYIEKIILFLSRVVATAQASMGVENEALETHLRDLKERQAI